MANYSIKSKSVYYFRNPEFPEKPHYHIFLSSSTPFLISVCTSQKENQKTFLGTEREDFLLKINHSVIQNATLETYVNCWETKEILQEVIESLILIGDFKYSGQITNEDYIAILNLLLKSRAVSFEDKEYIRNELANSSL